MWLTVFGVALVAVIMVVSLFLFARHENNAKINTSILIGGSLMILLIVMSSYAWGSSGYELGEQRINFHNPIGSNMDISMTLASGSIVLVKSGTADYDVKVGTTDTIKAVGYPSDPLHVMNFTYIVPRAAPKDLYFTRGGFKTKDEYIKDIVIDNSANSSSVSIYGEDLDGHPYLLGSAAPLSEMSTGTTSWIGQKISTSLQGPALRTVRNRRIVINSSGGISS